MFIVQCIKGISQISILVVITCIICLYSKEMEKLSVKLNTKYLEGFVSSNDVEAIKGEVASAVELLNNFENSSIFYYSFFIFTYFLLKALPKHHQLTYLNTLLLLKYLHLYPFLKATSKVLPAYYIFSGKKISVA